MKKAWDNLGWLLGPLGICVLLMTFIIWGTLDYENRAMAGAILETDFPLDVESNPLIAAANGEIAYTPVTSTPFFTASISEPRPVGIPTIKITYQIVENETNYQVMRRQIVTTQTHEQFLRVGAIQ